MFQNLEKARKLLSLSTAQELMPVPAASHLQLTAACAAAAQNLLWLFDCEPKLDALQLTCVCRIHAEPLTDHVRAEHHFKLTTEGVEVRLSEPERLRQWVQEHLPFAHFGNGTLRIERSDPVVQGYLRLDHHNDTEEIFAAVQRLAHRMFTAFCSFEVVHDVDF